MWLRIATLNVWALPEPFAPDVPARMRAIGDHLPKLELDAVAFQEVWTGEAREILLDAGERAGLRHAWHNPGTLAGSGLLVLSRHPLTTPHFERFALPHVPPRLDHPDYYGRKGHAHLRMDTEGGPVELITTHLHARYGSDVPHEYRFYRVGQIVELIEAMRRTRVPVALLGDFNFREEEPEYRILLGLGGLRDSAAEAGRPEPTVFPGNPFRSRGSRERRIDYVFLRDGHDRGLRVRESHRVFDQELSIGGEPAAVSNHAGVLTEVEIDAPRPPPAEDDEARDLAAHWLEEGRMRATRRRREGRLLAGIGCGAALVASAGVRDPRLTRRRLLRGSLQGLGIAALAPGVGAALLSEVFGPDEQRVFERLKTLV